MTQHEVIELGKQQGAAEFSRCDATTIARMEQEQVREQVGVLAFRFAKKAGTKSSAYTGAFIDAFVSEWRKVHEALPEVVAQRASEAEEFRVKYANRRIDSYIADGNEVVARFAERLATNPFDAFEWGGDTVKAVAQLHVGQILRRIVDEHGLDAACREATERAMRGAQYPPSSTSPMGNLCETARTAAYAEFVAFAGIR